jgi:vanillate/3-O-methylgallate O-demethylase
MSTTITTLADLLSSKSDLVDHFYNDTVAPHVKAKTGLTPVPLEQSTWMEEQRAWRNSAVLFDQSHHMPELFVKGPDAIKLLSKLGVNSFDNFKPGVAKQYIACNEEGKVIGETLMYCHGSEDFELVSGMPLINWVEYNAIKGGYNVTVERDNNTARNSNGKRKKFRFGMDGPNASKIFTEVVENGIPEIRFFGTGMVKIGGCDVMALRHGMAGHQGVELSGDYDDQEKVLDALIQVGEKHGLKRGGTLAYFSAVTEGGWMASPFPAIFTSPSLNQYRQWLPANSWEAGAQLGGSYIGSKIEDYYVTPWDLGVEKRIKFDHDFIGREALEKQAANPTRCRRTLVWNSEDVAAIFASILEPGLAGKMLRLPYASYAYQMYDEVRTEDGALAGLSTFVGYSANETKVLSLAMMDLSHADVGTELLLTWGEPYGGSRKSHVERHRQMKVRVTVAPTPYAETVHKLKHGIVK